MTPTARTLEFIRQAGGIADIVERRLPIPGKFITRDLFGFADVFAITADGECSLVQVTSGANVAARVTKARAVIASLPQLQGSGLRLVVHGWSYLKAGWTLRVVEL